MGNLIVDIGNTAVKAAFTEGLTLGKTFRYQGERVNNFILSLTEREKPEVMVISSVYEIQSRDENDYASACGSLVILDAAHTSFLRDSNLPEWLSFDRAASIIAVRHLFNGKSCTIIDFGTTLTVDFIDSEGNYEGGNISLGCRTRFKAINRYSRSLPLIDTPEDSPVLGNSLDTSISSGILSGIMFEIAGYVSEKQDNIVVFTGGDAIYFAKRIKNSIFVICNLVLIGLALIADGYVNENK